MKGFKTLSINGFTDNELERLKAELETDLYGDVATILDKAFQLANDNEFGNDPGFIVKRAQNTRPSIVAPSWAYMKNT